MENKCIYLDYNASTPIAPEVAAAMEPFLHEAYGNPSSTHWAGMSARDAVETARAKVAGLIGANPDEVVFTSGATEASNLAIQGLFFAAAERDRFHVVTTAVEHPATLAPCRFLERQGAAVTILPVDGTGRVDPDDLRAAITPRTRLVSVMHANNEVGTLQPIEAIGEITRRYGVPLHVDAAQSAGKIPVNVDALGADLLSLAGHKMYAPKGVGALFVRSGVTLSPLLHGGRHENGRRAGTESALLTVGLGTAAELAGDLEPMARVAALRDELRERLRERFGKRVVLNGHPRQRLPNTLNVSFVGHAGPAILNRLQGIAASTGSACHVGEGLSSPLLAMGLPPEIAAGAVRFSLGRETTVEEIAEVVKRLETALLRCMD